MGRGLSIRCSQRFPLFFYRCQVLGDCPMDMASNVTVFTRAPTSFSLNELTSTIAKSGDVISGPPNPRTSSTVTSSPSKSRVPMSPGRSSSRTSKSPNPDWRIPFPVAHRFFRSHRYSIDEWGQSDRPRSYLAVDIDKSSTLGGPSTRRLPTTRVPTLKGDNQVTLFRRRYPLRVERESYFHVRHLLRLLRRAAVRNRSRTMPTRSSSLNGRLVTTWGPRNTLWCAPGSTTRVESVEAGSSLGSHFVVVLTRPLQQEGHVLFLSYIGESCNLK